MRFTTQLVQNQAVNSLLATGILKSTTFCKELSSPNNSQLYFSKKAAAMFIMASLSLFPFLRLDSSEHQSQGCADQLSQLESGVVSEFADDLTICGSKPDGSSIVLRHESSTLPASKIDVSNVGPVAYTFGLHSQPLDKSLLAVTPVRSQTAATSQAGTSAVLDWLLDPRKEKGLLDRVLGRLVQMEAHEVDPWLKQDYRQAFICISLAAKGNTEPFLASSYTVYGTHPSKVWAKIQANRQAKLAKEYSDWWDAFGNRKPDVPKKPSSTFNERAEQFTNSRLPIPFPTKERA